MRINNFKNSHRGFSLLEMSIVMGISGFLMVTGMQMYKIYIKGLKKVETYETMNKIDNAIGAFYAGQKRYPCPADPALPIGDPNAGVENCNLGAPVVAMGACNASGGFCNVPGRDADNDTVQDGVLIGAIPYKTMKLARDDLNPVDGVVQDDVTICNKAYVAILPLPVPPPSPLPLPANCIAVGVGMTDLLSHERSIEDLGAEGSLDAWGNQMTYAVTTRLTSNAVGVFDINYGAVAVQTEDGTHLTNPEASAMWVLVSHGQDGNGAFRVDGVRKACGTVTKDIENCNDDSKFINGVLSMGTDYFDDMTYYGASRLSSLWTNAQTNAVAGSDEKKDITNRNTGNVGIGIAAGVPLSAKLEIANKLRAKSVMSGKVCDSTVEKCFEQGIFGGSPVAPAKTAKCPPPSAGFVSVIRRIELSTVKCDEVEMKKAGEVQDCKPNEAMQGIDNLGKIICVTLP